MQYIICNIDPSLCLISFPIISLSLEQVEGPEVDSDSLQKHF